MPGDAPEPVAGIKLAAIHCGLRATPEPDLALLSIAEGSNVAAMFTQNQFCAAPVLVAKQHSQQQTPRMLLINAVNANVGNGAAGVQVAQQCCQQVAALAGCQTTAVLPFSTGVIGQPLPVEKLQAALPELYAGLNVNAWQAAARAIMTTDTVPKWSSRQLTVDGKTVTITGIAKGAGMICPNMATMLAFIATDAMIAPTALPAVHAQAVAESFHRITVDGDTSTNDACVLIATGASGVADSADSSDFITALHAVYRDLAQAIIRDAEGASKFVTIRVEQGVSVAACRQIATTIAHSPLVKTALYASDANWGRILAAIGRAGVPLVIDKVSLQINAVPIFHNGQLVSDYTETAGAAAMAASEIEILVQLGQGEYSDTLWTSDLSHDYVTINASYRS